MQDNKKEKQSIAHPIKPKLSLERRVAIQKETNLS